MRLGLVLHPTREAAEETALAILEAATRRDVAIVADADDLDRLPGAVAFEEGGDSVDAIVAVGGDGTMLEAAHRARASGVPVVGVNTGTVGYLTEVEPAAVERLLDALVTGEYRISERMTLEVVLPDGTVATALNDVVAEKAISQHVVTLAVSVDGDPLAEYRADGIIVATPTGSTAYTYSAGGPLVDPAVDALILTAVAPHSIFGRAIVLGGASKVTISVAGERAAVLHADGRALGRIDPGSAVTVSRGDTRDRIIRIDATTFATAMALRFNNAR